MGHFVLPRFYDKETNSVNWDDLKRAISAAVRFQDNVIDYTTYFLEENEDQQKGERRIGIGTLGLGTLMIKMGLRYGSVEGNKFLDELYKFIAVEEYKASIDLAEEKGAFPEFNAHKMSQSGFMQRIMPELPEEYQDKFYRTGIRNVTINTQAPTGSTGTMLDNIPKMRDEFGGATTGIEPYFMWEYFRASRLGRVQQVVPIAQDYMEKHGLTDVSQLPDYFVTAMDLTAEEHVGVQAAIQKWTDSSISKTANVPAEFTVEETADLYLKGYEMGLKGITIYRDGSRDTQVLAGNEEDAKLSEDQFSSKKKDVKEVVEEIIEETEGITKEDLFEATKRVPSRLYGMREKIKYQSNNRMTKAYIHIYVDENGEPIEVWINPVEPSDKDMADALGRMTTQFLRFGITNNNIDQAVKHLMTGKTMQSLPYKVGKILSDVYYGKINMDFDQKPEEDKRKKETSTNWTKDQIDAVVSQQVKSNNEIKLAKCEECGKFEYDKPNCICYACGFSSCN